MRISLRLLRWLLPGLALIPAILRADEQAAPADGTALPASEAPPDDKFRGEKLPDEKFFDEKIRPLLLSRCVECHGAEKQKGGLRLDNRAAAFAGGDSGESLVPGKPDESLLIQVIRYSGDLKMPPRSKLPEAEIALLVDWVSRGAAWSKADPTSDGPKPQAEEPSGPLFSDEARQFWAFQPIHAAGLPAVKNEAWPQNPLDRFILADLERSGIAPAARADKRTLIRRATLDLTGLPPTPAEVAAFLADETPGAFARVVDRLLDSPRYGERWGRHWLDVARYADSNGLDENLAYASAWRYRDYVIAAFNADKPFDRFIHEQIAGDLLPDAGGTPGLIERLTATGFLTLGGKMLAEDDPVKMQMDIVDEQVDTIGRAFLALTLGCARCHAHKYDPIPQEDYYSLAGIFKSTKTMENFNVVARWQERPLASAEAVAARDAHAQAIAAKKAEVAAIIARENEALVQEARRQVGAYVLAATHQQQLDRLLQTRLPAGNDPVLREQPGTIVIEAEDFVRGNVLKDRQTYGKEIGVLVNKGEQPNFTEYEVEAQSATLYQLELRYAAAESRPCKILINGQTYKTDAAARVTGTWFPDSQTWFVEGFFPLAAGKNVIRLEHPVFFPHIDKLLLVPARDETGEPIPVPNLRGPLGEPFAPQAQFVTQWSAFLSKTDDVKSPIARAWKALSVPQLDSAKRAGDKPVDDLEQAVRERISAEPRPVSQSQLARRFAELFTSAEAAWQEQQKTAAGRQLAALPDPVLEAFRQALYDPAGPFAIPKDSQLGLIATPTDELRSARDQQKVLEQALPVLPEAMSVSDGKPENIRVHLRGSHLTLGKETPRQFPRILAGEQQTPIAADRSGRLQFAEWLTSPQQPLTARVIVNRVWLWHFGEGIVRSPDNFGLLGERPTHPQLLDHLASQFMTRGWSLKDLHRQIMNSATYQMSTKHNEAAAATDPENRLWWRMNRRRLEAEAIRDSILSVSGTLDLTMGGSLLTTPNRQYVTSTANVNPVIYEAKRRAVYLPVIRSALYDVFQAFDFADPSTLNGRRDSTTVAPQALFMLNSKLVLEQTKALATQLLADEALDDARRIGQLYERALSRTATPEETSRGLEFVEKYTQAAGGKGFPEEDRRLRAWQALCRTVLASNEFVYIE